MPDGETDDVRDAVPRDGERTTLLIVGAGGLGREVYHAALESARARFHTVITPTARVTTRPDRLGEGCFVDHYALISTDVTIGPHSHVGAHATIGHDVMIGEGCHVGAFCFVGGTARIGAGVTLRSHATVSPGVVIEDGATVGPNTLVLRRVGAGETVLGVPGRRVVV